MKNLRRFNFVRHREAERWRRLNGYVELMQRANKESDITLQRESLSQRVAVLLSAPKHSNPNLLPIGERFGFAVFSMRLLNVAHKRKSLALGFHHYLWTFRDTLLLFVINNPEYLDAKKFDEYIDSNEV